MRAMGLCSFLANDFRQLAPGGVEVLVNYTVFELPGVLQLFARVIQPAADHGVGILRSAAHAALELLYRRRQDEDSDAVRVDAAHLPGALPIDLEDQVIAPRQGLRDDALRGAVAVA